MPVVKPDQQVRTLQTPWKVLVMRADPAFEYEKRHEPFYRFSNGRRFDENTAIQGAYSPKPHDNP